MSTAPLLEADLGPDERAAYMRDLSALAEIEFVQVEFIQIADAQRTRRCRLDEAFAAMENGSASRVLFRYCYDGQRWCDTLMASDSGFRLVRIAEKDALGS